ncbi:MAG: hypothetical protein ACKPBV_00235 [Sphaerospermopsis kisseleviana]
MSRNLKDHCQRTKELAQALAKSEIYDWLVTQGYFPEAYVAFQYKYLIKTDIKNFYPSIYTHSIPWALHKKDVIFEI